MNGKWCVPYGTPTGRRLGLLISGTTLTYLNDIIWSTTGFQVATVHGAIEECGNLDYPGLYIRLDDPDVYRFLIETIKISEEN